MDNGTIKEQMEKLKQHQACLGGYTKLMKEYTSNVEAMESLVVFFTTLSPVEQLASINTALFANGTK